jgi:hypothetical protein
LNFSAALDRDLLQFPGGHEHRVRKSAAGTNGKMDQPRGDACSTLGRFGAIRLDNISQRVLI